MADASKSRVLVVEDDAQLRQTIASNPAARGHNVREGATVAQALAGAVAEHA